MVRAWITKYALTQGIYEVDDGTIDERWPSMLAVPSMGTFAAFHGEGRDWHRSLPAAQARAEAMRKAKIASLERQAVGLRELEIGIKRPK